MPNKPGFFGEHIWSAFQDPSVVRAYKHRPLYTPQAIQHIASLCAGTPRRVLDLGCGSGNVCRDLVPLVDEIDAIDASSAMIEEGRRLPNGNDPKIRWIVGFVESVPLHPPYALATAGSSIHWMDWDVLLPLLARVLNPAASLAILQNSLGQVPWQKELAELTPRFTVNKEKVPYNVIEELERRGLFTVSGRL